jgi:hypothetical protein
MSALDDVSACVICSVLFDGTQAGWAFHYASDTSDVIVAETCCDEHEAMYEAAPLDWLLRAAVALAQDEVREYVAAGVIPASVASFSDLHDYLDANTLGGLCDDGMPEACGSHDAWVTFGNDLQDNVHEWLVAGRPEGGAS